MGEERKDSSTEGIGGNVLAFAPLATRLRPPPITDEEILRFRSMLVRFERLDRYMERLNAEDGCPVAHHLLRDL